MWFFLSRTLVKYRRAGFAVAIAAVIVIAALVVYGASFAFVSVPGNTSIAAVVPGLTFSHTGASVPASAVAGDESFRYSFPERFRMAEKRVSIVFAGDLMQHLPQTQAAKTDSAKYSYRECFEHIASLFRESDLSVVNLETTLSDTPPYSGYPTFRAPSQLASDMKDAGIDVALLANNHICDNGSRGIHNTISALDSVGIFHTGAFTDSARFAAENPLVIHRNGFRINILNYTYGTNGISVPKGRIVNLIDTAAIARDLSLIEPSEDNLTFVCLHWGYEYNSTHSPEQKSLSLWLRSKGVDFIIGGHPHVIQPAFAHRDSVGGAATGVTVYSLGNFVSNQRRPGTDGGMAVRLDITKAPGQKAEVDPFNMFVWTYRPVENGRRRYYVLPPFKADEILRSDSTAMKSYKTFIDNARKVIGTESGFIEQLSIDNDAIN